MARNVFVTGATSGIGLCIAEAYAKYGDNVLISGRRAEVLAEVQGRLSKEYGVRVETLVLDVRSREDVESKVPAAIEAFGGVDVLVNNAGLAQGLDPFQDSTVDDAVTMIDTNVKGLLYVTKAVLPYMIDKNAGHIVNMGSTAGIYAYPGGAVYCATKAAVKMLSDGIRMDTIATDIKVTTIQPGIVETPFSEVRFHGDAERAKAVYAGIDAIQPEDVADVVLYVTNLNAYKSLMSQSWLTNKQLGLWCIRNKISYDLM